MANYDSNYAIAQEISARIGNSPIPFDSVYSIALEIYNELGGEPSEFDSVYEILLSILPLVEGGIASKVIDDNSIVLDKTWSSSKINEEIQAVAGTANSDIEGKETEDIRFVSELPVDGEEGEQVVIRGENSDTLYKYINGAWVSQTPDATKLYFDVENEALYSYVTADGQFAPVSMVNTIVVGSNLNSNAALKAIKTPGVYSVVQRLHSSTKGDYIKNWTLTVEGIDYDEYERTDSIYQRIQSNYTIQKRTWSSTRVTNDGWSNFSTYYAGEIKDSTTSKYYTWSSNKLSSMFNSIPQLEAGENIEIADNKINAKGYSYNEDSVEGNINFAELPFSLKQNLVEEVPLSQIGMSDLKVTGNAGVTTYILSGENAADFLSLPAQYYAMFGLKLVNGDYAFLASVDEENSTVTFKNTLNASQDLNEVSVDCLIMDATITVNGSANTTTYTFVDNLGMASRILRDTASGSILLFENYGERKVSSIDVDNFTITLNETLDASNPIVNEKITAIIPSNNISSGIYSHSEGYLTQATGNWGSHAEGQKTIASGNNSHAEGSQTQASGEDSHAKGFKTQASGLASHAEGFQTKATAQSSHAEGQNTIASGQASHAEGWGSSDSANTASGYASHVEGGKTLASGNYSHSEGYQTQALGNNSHAEGYNTIAYGGHVEGYWNIPDNTETTVGSKIYNSRYTNIIGNGYDNNRSNAYTLGLNGKGWYQTDVMCGGSNEDTAIHRLSNKQDSLTAGSNITISGTTISATYEVATTADIEALFS